jgi:uncharacterized protein YcbX
MKQISGIYIYPVKSLGAVALRETAVETWGLAYDRQWMIVDLQGMFLSQRKVPAMALIQPTLQGNQLVLANRANPQDCVSTPLSGPVQDAQTEVQVWNDTVHAKVCADAVQEWLSDQLGVFCRLVFLPRQNARPLSQHYGEPGEATLFADSCPILITGEEALQDLNSHLAEPVPMSRFRPNLVFSGGTAFEEDEWKTFHIGHLRLRGVRKCTRCKMVNIDQQTAVVYQEPLATLSKYRRDAQGINFGLHAALAAGQEAASIRLGDQISV